MESSNWNEIRAACRQIRSYAPTGRSAGVAFAPLQLAVQNLRFVAKIALVADRLHLPMTAPVIVLKMKVRHMNPMNWMVVSI